MKCKTINQRIGTWEWQDVGQAPFVGVTQDRVGLEIHAVRLVYQISKLVNRQTIRGRRFIGVHDQNAQRFAAPYGVSLLIETVPAVVLVEQVVPNCPRTNTSVLGADMSDDLAVCITPSCCKVIVPMLPYSAKMAVPPRSSCIRHRTVPDVCGV